MYLKKLTYLLLLLFLWTSTLLASPTKEAILTLDTIGHIGKIRDIIVSKSGDIISASTDKTIRVWDSKTGKEKRKILGQIGVGNRGVIYAIALSNDEKYLAVGGYLGGGQIRLYNYQSGKLLALLRSHTSTVIDLNFSKDGHYLLSSSADKTVKIWNMNSIENNPLLETISFHKDFVYAVAFTSENNIVSAGYDNTIALHSLSGTLLKSYTHNKKLQYIAIKENTIATSGDGDEILLFDNTLRLKQKIKNKIKPSGLAYSPNESYLIVGSGGYAFNDIKKQDILFPFNINIYDAKNNYKKISSLDNKHSNTANVVGFIDDRTAVSAGGGSNEIYVWDIFNSTVKTKIIGQGGSFHSVGIEGDIIGFRYSWMTAKKYSSFTKSLNLKTLEFFNTVDPAILSSINSKGLSVSKGGPYGYSNATLNIEEKKISITRNPSNGMRHRCYGWYKNYIISGGDFGQLEIYDHNGQSVANLIGHTGKIVSIALYGDTLVSASEDLTIKLWDLKQITKRLKIKIMKVVRNSLANKSGLQVNDQIISINQHRFRSRKQFNKYLSQKNKKFVFQVLRDGKELNVTINKLQGPIGFYTQYTINPIVSLFIDDNNEWVLWTQDGFFNASKDGTKYIGYHINQGSNKEAEYVGVDALYSTFYRPDLILKALKGEDLSKYAKNINIENLLQDGFAPEVHILTKTQKTKKQDFEIKVQVCPKEKGGYDNLALTINDIPVQVIDTGRALKIKKKSKRDDCFIYNQTISLMSGKNTIGFKATNKAGNIESKVDTIELTFDNTQLKQQIKTRLAKVVADDKINDLHILAIAVNKYQDKELQLNYSIHDATQMLNTIQDVGKPLFNKVHTYKLFDKAVTKSNIKKAFKNIKSSRDDVFLLYIAGHGITDQYNGNYYYIPFDFINKDDKEAVQMQGIGQQDFMIGLSNITALKSLVLLDTCDSGSFVEADMQKTTTNRLAKATGRATISASSKSQVALEGFKEHGVFTYTLLEALKGKGYNADNQISTNELSDYVETTLPNRTFLKWGYRQIPQKSMYGVDFILGEKIDK